MWHMPKIQGIEYGSSRPSSSTWNSIITMGTYFSWLYHRPSPLLWLWCDLDSHWQVLKRSWINLLYKNMFDPCLTPPSYSWTMCESNMNSHILLLQTKDHNLLHRLCRKSTKPLAFPLNYQYLSTLRQMVRWRLSIKNLYLTHSSWELSERWLGPYKIISLAGPNAIKLQLLRSMQIHLVVNVSQLKPYHECMEE